MGKNHVISASCDKNHEPEPLRAAQPLGNAVVSIKRFSITVIVDVTDGVIIANEFFLDNQSSPCIQFHKDPN